MIPKKFVEKNLEKAKGARFFGVPVEELSKNELIACAIAGWQANEDTIKESARQRDFLRPLRLGKPLN